MSRFTEVLGTFIDQNEPRYYSGKHSVIWDDQNIMLSKQERENVEACQATPLQSAKSTPRG